MNGSVGVLPWIMFEDFQMCSPWLTAGCLLNAGAYGAPHCAPLVLAASCFRSPSTLRGFGCSEYCSARISRRAALRRRSWSHAAVLSIVRCILGSQSLGLRCCSKREEAACWGRVFFTVLFCCFWLIYSGVTYLNLMGMLPNSPQSPNSIDQFDAFLHYCGSEWKSAFVNPSALTLCFW